MRQYHQVVFDRDVNGTNALYTSDEFNALLSSADVVLITYVASGATGTSPTLSITIETGPDGEHFLDSGTPEVNADALSADTFGAGAMSSEFVLSGKTRLKIQLGGTSPGVSRLRVWVTGRGN